MLKISTLLLVVLAAAINVSYTAGIPTSCKVLSNT